VKILSGVFQTPQPAPGHDGYAHRARDPEMSISAPRIIPRSPDKYRPGHADYTYDIKYGIRDYRGGGRQSARETATRVAAGAIARKVVPGMRVRAALIQMGAHKIERARWNWEEVERNPFFCPDPEQAKFLEGYLDNVRRRGSSVGAVTELRRMAFRQG
jgi:chorismate synthase